MADDAAMAAERAVLTVTCPKCREPFASALQIDPDTWSGMAMHKDMIERCSHCRQPSMFAKRDYYFQVS